MLFCMWMCPSGPISTQIWCSRLQWLISRLFFVVVNVFDLIICRLIKNSCGLVCEHPEFGRHINVFKFISSVSQTILYCCCGFVASIISFLCRQLCWSIDGVLACRLCECRGRKATPWTIASTIHFKITIHLTSKKRSNICLHFVGLKVIPPAMLDPLLLVFFFLQINQLNDSICWRDGLICIRCDWNCSRPSRKKWIHIKGWSIRQTMLFVSTSQCAINWIEGDEEKNDEKRLAFQWTQFIKRLVNPTIP